MITVSNKSIILVPDEVPIQTEREKELMKPFEVCFKEVEQKFIKNYFRV